MDPWQTLRTRITPEREARLLQAVSRRTRHITVAIQDIHNQHNVSACLRTAEGLGLARVHVVNLKESFKPTTVASGSTPWLEIHRHKEISACVQELKADGFRLAAAYPTQDCLPLEELPVDKPLALIFGNEAEGLSKEWLDHCDVRFTIPMFGLVESFNISVSCAMSLYATTRRARQALGDDHYFLSQKQQTEILNLWAERQLQR